MMEPQRLMGMMTMMQAQASVPLHRRPLKNLKRMMIVCAFAFHTPYTTS
jgi:hypothetical protein